MKLQSFSAKWGETPKTVVNTRVKRVIVPGRLVELKKIDSRVLQAGQAKGSK